MREKKIIALMLAAAMTGTTAFSQGMFVKNVQAADGAANVIAEIDAGDLKIGLNEDGVIEELVNETDGVNYAGGVGVPKNPLIKLIMAPTEAEGGEESGKDGTEIKPDSLKVNGNVYTFGFENGVEVDVTATDKEEYTTLEVTRLDKNGLDVEMLVWGPIATNIEENFGETIGAVYNDEFGIGFRGLNDKSQMGCPYEYSGITIDGQKRLNVCYPIDSSKMKGRKHSLDMCAASPTTWGSTLQGYTYDSTVQRVRKPWGPITNLRVPAQKGDLAVIEGSEIAIYGKDFGEQTAKEAILDTVEQIELAEDLPHPMIDGEWQKTSAKAAKPYFIANVSAGTVDKLSQYANMADIDNIYKNTLYNGSGAGASYQFPGGDQNLKEQIVDKAAKYDVNVGTHTLSGFIDTYDPYVTQKAGKGNFCGQLLARLTKDAKAGDKEVYVTEDWVDYGDTKQIGDDLFYSGVKAEKAEGGYKITLPTALKNNHTAGEQMIGLVRNAYGGYVAGLEQIDGIAKRLAESFNNTGLTQISFDGVEVGVYAGLGLYGSTHLMNEFYCNLKPEIQANIINDSSGGYPGSWDLMTRGNWGEPWGAPMRGGMIDYRYDNQVYFERNFLPKMLGWFMYNGGEPTIDIEWMLSKSAGFNAGYALVTDTGTLDGNGNTPEVMEAVKQWQDAREADAFTEDQKARMLDTSTDWHLVNKGENSWELYRINYPINPVKALQKTKGYAFQYGNIFHTQDLHFEMQAENGPIKNPVIKIGNKLVSFNTTIPQNGYLVYDNGEAVIYDSRWNETGTAVTVNDPGVVVEKGVNKVNVKYDAENSSVAAKIRILTESEPEPVFPGNPATAPVEEPEEVVIEETIDNIAFHKPVTATNVENGSFPNDVNKIVDGVTESQDSYNVEYAPNGGVQNEKAYITVDLEQSYDLSEVKFYSFTTHDYPDYYRINKNTIVMVSNDPEFKDDSTQIIYNNDADNSMGFGVGTDPEEKNTPDGKSIVFDKPVNARYIRYYQDGAVQLPTPGDKNGILSLVELEAYAAEEEDDAIHLTDIRTYKGVAPVLPILAEEAGYLPITWEAIPEDAYQKAGSFTVNGTVANGTGKVSVNVIVTEQPVTKLSGSDLVNVEESKDVKVNYGVYGLKNVTKQTVSFYYDKTVLFFPQDGSGVKALQDGVKISNFALNNESAVFSFDIEMDAVKDADLDKLVELDFTVRDDVEVGSGKTGTVEVRSAEVTAGGETVTPELDAKQIFILDGQAEEPEEPEIVTVTVSSVRDKNGDPDGNAGDDRYVAEKAIDGDLATSWAAKQSDKSPWIQLSNTKEKEISQVILVERGHAVNQCGECLVEFFDKAGNLVYSQKITDMKWEGQPENIVELPAPVKASTVKITIDPEVKFHQETSERGFAEVKIVEAPDTEQSEFTIKVNGKTKTYHYNDEVTITAPAKEGYKFASWEVNGEIVSYEETYKFYVSKSMELTAVYVADADVDDIEKEVRALLTNVFVTKRDDGKSNVKFVGELVVPEGYKVLEAGLVWSSKDNKELVTEDGQFGEGLKPTYISKISDTNQFSVTIKGMPADRFIRGVIFAKVADKDGNETYIFSTEEKVYAAK